MANASSSSRRPDVEEYGYVQDGQWVAEPKSTKYLPRCDTIKKDEGITIIFLKAGCSRQPGWNGGKLKIKPR
jgi:hypothetical protein